MKLVKNAPLLWKQKFHYRVHRSQPVDAIVGTEFHNFTPYLFENQFNIIFPSSPRSTKLPSSSYFPIKILYAFLIYPKRSTWTP